MDQDQPNKKISQFISLTDEEAVQQIINDTLFDLWKMVNTLTRLRPSKRPRYRVTIFGSAREKPQSLCYEQVKHIAKVLASMDCDIVTGGGPGIMQAANEGAAEAAQTTASVGIRIDLPFEPGINPFVKQAYMHGSLFTRLHHFVLASDAFIVFPGGIGTILESIMIWQLLQVKYITDIPLIFVGEMWADLIVWAHHHLLSAEIELVNPEDLKIPICVNTGDEAVSILRHYQAEWLQKQNL